MVDRGVRDDLEVSAGLVNAGGAVYSITSFFLIIFSLFTFISIPMFHKEFH